MPRPTQEPAPAAWPPIVHVGIGLVVAAGVVARFVTGSPLWLDEALSVHIAELGVGELADALRQDGHPPLYYALLSWWIDLVGDGDAAVRALSGLFSVLALPLAWIAGRRRAGRTGALATLVLFAVAPWMVRYGTETRMYALVATAVLAGWLLADDLLRTDERWRVRAGGLAACTALALLSHYWALYLGAVAVVAAGWRWRTATAEERTRLVRVVAALAVGAAAFLPWLPVFIDQASTTGTPWAGPSRPTTAVLELLHGLGGGQGFAEGPLFGVAVLLLAAVGLFGRPVGPTQLTVDFRTVPGVRLEWVVWSGTLVVGLLAGYATGATFVARYAAVFLPFLLIAAGVGVARLPGRWVPLGALVVVTLLGAAGIAKNAVDDRTQGAEIAAAVRTVGTPGDVVAFCPDQLGPSAVRELPPGAFDTVGIPAFDDPRRIDWRDYAARNRSADGATVGQALLDRAAGDRIFLVVNDSYRTYEGLCEAVFDTLAAARPGRPLVADAGDAVFEHGALYVFEPAAP